MGLLETLKSCYTCRLLGERDLSSCGIRYMCCLNSNVYKCHWTICQPCKSCKRKNNILANYMCICAPCFKNDYSNWKPHSKGIVGEFKVPY